MGILFVTTVFPPRAALLSPNIEINHTVREKETIYSEQK